MDAELQALLRLYAQDRNPELATQIAERLVRREGVAPEPVRLYAVTAAHDYLEGVRVFTDRATAEALEDRLDESSALSANVAEVTVNPWTQAEIEQLARYRVRLNADGDVLTNGVACAFLPFAEPYVGFPRPHNGGELCWPVEITATSHEDAAARAKALRLERGQAGTWPTDPLPAVEPGVIFRAGDLPPIETVSACGGAGGAGTQGTHAVFVGGDGQISANPNAGPFLGYATGYAGDLNPGAGGGAGGPPAKPDP